MTGSPTILLDGVDPFAAAGAAPTVSCRIYRGPDGAADGAPSVQDLTAALSAAGLPGAAGDEGVEADVPDPVGRAGRSRRAPAAGGLRAVHQAVLRHFTATGSARRRRRWSRPPPGTGALPGRCWPSWTAGTS